MHGVAAGDGAFLLSIYMHDHEKHVITHFERLRQTGLVTEDKAAHMTYLLLKLLSL